MRSPLSGVGGLLTVLIIGLLGVTPVLAQEYWAAVGPDGGLTVKELSVAATPEVAGTDQGAAGVEVRAEVPGLRLAPVKTVRGEFVELGWPEASLGGAIGEPALPVIRRLFVAPPGATVTVTVKEGRALTIDSAAAGFALRPMPKQAPVPKLPGAREAAPFNYNEAAYVSRATMPAARAAMAILARPHICSTASEVSFTRMSRQ